MVNVRLINHEDSGYIRRAPGPVVGYFIQTRPRNSRAWIDRTSI